MPFTLTQLRDFATRYTAAWCSQYPEAVAAFFAPSGSLTINDGAPSVGRPAIANAARDFMTAFPNLQVFFDDLRQNGERIEYHWTLSGTNTGPGGTGKKIRITGYEEWKFGPDDLIEASLGHFDAADYARQLTA